MAKKQSSKKDEWREEVCIYKHELVEKDQKILDDKLNNIKKDIDLQFEEIKKLFKENHLNLKNQIKITKESLHNKIDEIDIAIRGDLNTGKVGVLEKTRDIAHQLQEVRKKINNYIKSISLSVKIIIILLLFIVGGKIFGVSLDEIKKYFHKDSPPEVKQIEKIIIPTENKGKSIEN